MPRDRLVYWKCTICKSDDCCFFAGAATSGACLTCAAGSYSAAGQSTCILCIQGFDENSALYAPCSRLSTASPTTGTAPYENKTSSVPENGGSTNLNSTVIAAAACAVGAFAGCIYWRRRRSGKIKPSNVSLVVLFPPYRACIDVLPRVSTTSKLD